MTQDDKELTALAARAYQDAPEGFSPLTDDGDALRLAVKLGMEVCAEHRDCAARAYVPGAVQGYGCDYAACDGDMNAATRKAIVIAAAESARAALTSATEGKKL
jgi:hypothetical protein